MAVKFKRPLLVVNSVAPGRTATIRVPSDPRYYKFVLHVSATGQVANQIIDKIRLKVGTKVQRVFTPDELDTEMLLLGEDGSTRFGIQNNVAGEQIDIPIWLTEPWRKGYVAQGAGAWGTGDVPDGGFVIEVDIAAAADASVDMSATALYDNPTDDKGVPLAMGFISKWYEDDIPVTGLIATHNGLEKVDDLQSITLHDGDITKVEFIVGDVVIREVNTQENESDLVGYGMTPQTDKFHLVFDDDDDLRSAVPLGGRKNVYLRITTSDATPRNIRAVIQRLGRRD